jgi:hypothetical protein
VNWQRGSQFTVWHTKNHLQFDEKSHNSGMKNWNFTKKTINSNNCAKFEVNWPRGSQFTARHTKIRLQFDEKSPITLEWKIEISPKSIQTIRLSIPITMQSLKWIGKGVLNLQRDIQKIVLKSRTIWWIKSHNSGMKIRNITIKYTDRKTINSNTSVKCEVNWPRGS